MIPKIIHYCWFGGKPLPAAAQKCIASWKKYCPDYEIQAWTEENYDIASAPLYVQQAYEAKKWAFVTDVVRLYALDRFGGVYMDTDVEVVRPIDEFLKHHAFSGFEDEVNIPTGIMAAEQGHPLIKELLEHYDARPFLVDGEPDLTTNVKTITDLLTPKGFLPNNQFQEVAGFALYPYDYFCPRDIHTMEIRVTENTYTIHHFAGSWLSGEDAERRAYKLRRLKIEQRFGARRAAIYETLHFARKKHGGAGLASYAKKRVFRMFGRRGR